MKGLIIWYFYLLFAKSTKKITKLWYCKNANFVLLSILLWWMIWLIVGKSLQVCIICKYISSFEKYPNNWLIEAEKTSLKIVFCWKYPEIQARFEKYFKIYLEHFCRDGCILEQKICKLSKGFVKCRNEL